MHKSSLLQQAAEYDSQQAAGAGAGAGASGACASAPTATTQGVAPGYTAALTPAHVAMPPADFQSFTRNNTQLEYLVSQANPSLLRPLAFFVSWNG